MNSILVEVKQRGIDFLQGYIMIHLIWFIGYKVLDTPVVPRPDLVYSKIGEVLGKDVFLHIGHSLYRIAMGIILALIVGIAIGLLMASWKKWNQILYPLVYFTYPIPKTALLPIAMLLLGMRDSSKISIIFLIIVFQVIIAVRDSVLNIDKTMYQVVHSNGASRKDRIIHVVLPAILPDIITSIRISLGTALSILFFVEGYGTRYGMGYYIVDAWSRIQYVEMYLGILIISLVGFFLFAILDMIAYISCPWKQR